MTDETPYEKSIKKRQVKIKQDFINILKENPVIQVAVKMAGIGRETYYRWKKEDPNFLRESENALAQGFELINDLCESQLITHIKAGKMPPNIFWLKNHHKGYGADLQSHAQTPSVNDLSSEEEKIIVEALNLASGITINKKDYARENRKKLSPESFGE